MLQLTADWCWASTEQNWRRTGTTTQSQQRVSWVCAGDFTFRTNRSTQDVLSAALHSTIRVQFVGFRTGSKVLTDISYSLFTQLSSDSRDTSTCCRVAGDPDHQTLHHHHHVCLWMKPERKDKRSFKTEHGHFRPSWHLWHSLIELILDLFSLNVCSVCLHDSETEGDDSLISF